MLRATERLDRENRAAAQEHIALRLWLRLLTCTNLVEGRIRRQLRDRFDWTLPRFDLLAQLERSESGLKMSELSRRLMVTGGNVTALADQLEAEGMIRREAVADDRRATRLTLTPQGRRKFAQMAATHERWIVDLFGALTRDEQRQLHQLLGRLKAGLPGRAPQGDAGSASGPAGTATRPTPPRRSRR